MTAKAAGARGRDLEFGAFLTSVGVPRTVQRFKKSAVIFTQGEPAPNVMYVTKGTVKLAVSSQSGRAAVVGIVGTGQFFGEGCLAAQQRRTATATAISPTTVLVVERTLMLQLLRRHPQLSERFLTHMLERNIRVEADLVDQLFNSSEKRLARTLLLLAQYGEGETRLRVLPKLSQATLAEMIGTTRSRVNFFMNKFRRLGFIHYDGRITVNSSLVEVLLNDD